MRAEPPASPSTQVNASEVINKVRNKLKERGARGFIGLRRVFMIADDNHSLTLDREEFSETFASYRLQLSPEEQQTLFSAFDTNGDGQINFDEFLRQVVGEMNDFRRGLVWKAFQKLDKDGSGQVTKSDITGIYDASNHPDVRQGKKTEEEVLTDFLDTFEIHSALLNTAGSHDHKITFDEFCEYYNNVSVNIDDDAYFELMITNAWKLGEPAPVKQAWAN